MFLFVLFCIIQLNSVINKSELISIWLCVFKANEKQSTFIQNVVFIAKHVILNIVNICICFRIKLRLLRARQRRWKSLCWRMQMEQETPRMSIKKLKSLSPLWVYSTSRSMSYLESIHHAIFITILQLHMDVFLFKSKELNVCAKL